MLPIEKPREKKTIALSIVALFYGGFLIFILINAVVNAYLHRPEQAGFMQFLFFTNQSNFAVALWLLFYGGVALRNKNNRFSRFVQNKALITAITLYITITFLFTIFLLFPFWYGTMLDGFYGTLVFTHLITPIVMWVYFFMVDGVGGKIRFRCSFYFLIFPITYFVLAFTIGSLVYAYDFFGVYQPAFVYPFLDPNWYPHIAVFILAIIGMIGIFFGLGVGLLKLKNRLTHPLSSPRLPE